MTLRIQLQRKLIHSLELRHEIGKLRSRLRVPIEHTLDLGIGHSHRAANDSLADFISQYLAAAIDLHHAAEYQPILIRPETTDAARELRRQHWHCAVSEIDRRSAKACLEIKRRSRPYVVTHICDVNLQLVVSIRQQSHQHGIVKIARGLAIDRDDLQPAKVSSSPPLRCI